MTYRVCRQLAHREDRILNDSSESPRRKGAPDCLASLPGSLLVVG